MDPFLHIRLIVTSDDLFDPSVITRRLGIEPTKTFIKGTERVSPNGHVYPRPWQASGWILSLYEQTADLPAVLTRLVTTMEAVAEELADLRREFDLWARIGLHLKMADFQSPMGTLDADLLRRLAALDVDLDLDFYVVEDDYEPVDAAKYGITSATSESA